MKVIAQIWKYFNGRKTLIGAVVYFLAIQAKANGLVDDSVLGNIDNNVQTLATILTLLGLGHKGVKLIRSK